MTNERSRIAIAFILSFAVLAAKRPLPALAFNNYDVQALLNDDGYVNDPDFRDLLKLASAAISNWPGDRQLLAKMTIEKYGQPDEVAGDCLTWYRGGPWKRIVVFRDSWRNRDGIESSGALEQSVDYRVPRSRLSQLARYNPRVIVDPSAMEISYRSDSEETNFLVLNLADAVISDRMTPEQAQDIARKTAALSAEGKSSPYTQKLLIRNRHRPRESAQPFSSWDTSH